MNTKKLNLLSERFNNYVDSFRIDGALHPMHQLKLEHSIRVSIDAREIAAGMNWTEEEVNLAEAVGLFHDTARFPQFEKYKTFSDADSIDHGDLGFQTLEKEGLLDGLEAESRDLILHSVQYHNKKHLQPGLTERKEKHLRLIRDADRLDIFFICWHAIHTGEIHDNPEISMGIDFNGSPTDTVLDQFERGEAIDYRTLNSMADRFILLLSWIHDLSYNSTKRIVHERGILQSFIKVLPVKTDRLINCFKITDTFLASADQ